MSSFVAANSLAEALEAMAGGARPVAGGTDLVVGARQGKKPLPGDLVAVHRLSGLRGLEVLADGGLRIGALTSHAEIVANAVVRARYTALADASAIVGSHATRAHGTIGGNVMNASPAGETPGPLMCLGAVAVLASVRGERRVAVDQLATGPGRTVAAPDELLVALEIPSATEGTGSCYTRLEYRRHMEIAIVGVTVVVTGGDSITNARLALTAVGPTVFRVPSAEAVLAGALSDSLVAATAGALAAAATPISDVRGSSAYRRAMVEVLGRRTIDAALSRAAGHDIPIPASSALSVHRSAS